MTVQVYKGNLPTLSREEFFTSVDSLFNDVINQAFPILTKELGDNFLQRGSYPKIDAVMFNDKLTIEAEIPGLSKEDVTIDTESDGYGQFTLLISGGKRENDTKEKPDTGTYIIKELKRSSFKRSFILYEELFDKNGISAKFEHGVLLIEIPRIKPKEKLKNTITIK